MKSFKEFSVRGFAIGGVDQVHPMTSVGDRPPKGKGSRSGRASGLVASFASGSSSLKPVAIPNDAERTPLGKHLKKKGINPKKENAKIELNVKEEDGFKNFSEFKQHLNGIYLIETDTKAAKDMEHLLVNCANGNPKSRSYSAIESKVKNNKAALNTAIELGNYILKNSYGKPKVGGSIVKSGSVNKAEWLGSNRTPKTDIMLGGEKVSLKTGSAQLMSGGADEALSTYNVAIKNSTDLNNKSKKLAEEIEKGIKNLLPTTRGEFMGGVDLQKQGGTVYLDTKKAKYLIKQIADPKNSRKKGSLERELKSLKIKQVKSGTFNKDKVLKDADAHNQYMKGKFADLFKSSASFKREFVFEAMTGKVKFADGPATATHFLVVDYVGNSKKNEVKSSSADYVGKILSQVRPDVKFKTSAEKKNDTKTGHYKFWSTVGLGVNAVNKTQNEMYDMLNSTGSEYLTEGFWDMLGRLWNKIQSFLSNLFNKVKNYLEQGIKYIQEYLSLEPVISYNNNIRW
jgi:hypothetical protein